jgi:acetyl esterase/lipase
MKLSKSWMKRFRAFFEDSALTLLALSGLGVAMPLLDLFGQNPQFFVAKDHRRLEVFIFGLILAFLVPLVVITVEFLAYTLHEQLGRIAHIILVAGLGLLLALAVLRKLAFESDGIIWFGAGLTSLAILLAERFWNAFRRGLKYLSFAPLVAFLLFISFSPAARLIWVGEARPAPLPGIGNPAPVVMLFFDEFPVASLLAEDGTIDEQRFPNFARLADQAYWFRNNTSVVPWTAGSITTALTGNMLTGEKAPNSIDYPDNLFTLLGEDYDMRVHEEITRLCPHSICDQPLAIEGGTWTESTPTSRLVSSLLDAAVVYAHATLPPGMRAHLPSISYAMGGYLGQDDTSSLPLEDESGEKGNDSAVDEGGQPGELEGRSPGSKTAQAQVAIIEGLIASIQPSTQPTLYFAHAVFPHFPWELSPSGSSYLPNAHLYDDLGAIPGLSGEGDRWGGDTFLVRQGFQRHIMQVGYVDNLLGKLIDRMQAAGIWERSVFVLVADHGVSFVPDQPRRGPTPENLDEIYRVPFFLKLPGQEAGVMRDDVASLLDLMPTLVDVLEIETDWNFEGRTLLGESPPPMERWITELPGGTFSTSLDGLLTLAKRNVATFNHVEGWLGVAAVGEYGNLVEKQVSDLGSEWQSDFTWEIDQASAFTLVDFSSGYVPILLTGKVTVPAGMSAPGDVLIAVNQVIAGVGGGFYCQEGECQFSALLAEEVLREGTNQLAAFMSSSPSKAISTEPLEPAPEGVPRGMPPVGGGEIQVLHDLEYARVEVDGREKRLLLDLYLPPEGAPRPLPLLVYIHGGGWMEGSKEGCPGSVVAEMGFAMACVDYRLSQDSIFPAQIHDIKAAVRWLRAHAKEFQVDADRFGAWGDSAGGHLAALLGTSAGVPELEGNVGVQGVLSAVQAVCDWYGPTDFSRVPPAFVESITYPVAPEVFEHYGTEPWFEYTLATTLLLGGPVEERIDLAMFANPITYIDPGDPPFLIFHGERDEIVPIDQSILLVDALRTHGVEVVFVPDPERGHSVVGPPGVPFDPGLIEMAIGFFNTHLRP